MWLGIEVIEMLECLKVVPFLSGLLVTTHSSLSSQLMNSLVFILSCSFACRCSFIKFYFHLKIRKIIERGGGGVGS